MSLRDRLIKNSKLEYTSTLKDSIIYEDRKPVNIGIPMLDVALSGDVDGGLSSGITMIAGPSKHFKTMFSFLLVSAYMKKHPESVLLFYINEFGSPPEYFETFDIDMDRVVIIPFTDIEELKFDIVAQLEAFKKKSKGKYVDGATAEDKVVILIDSIGNAASKKEVEDALKENSAADMTRSKSLKSVSRMITPHLELKDIPLIAINHTYKTQEMYSKDVVSGGTGWYYAANSIWIIGRQQDKEGDELAGWRFIINIEKSRKVEEKSKIPITVKFDGGISRWSGLFDEALELGYITATKQGWYGLVDKETGEVSEKSYRRAQLEDNSTIWNEILSKTNFKLDIKKKYKSAMGKMLRDNEVSDVTEDALAIEA